MKNFEKNGGHFNNVWSLLALLSLFFGCSESPKNFTDFLYDLAEIDVENRVAYLDDWLNMQEEFPLIDGGDVYFIFKDKREVAIYLSGDMLAGNSEKIQLMKIIGTDYYFSKQSYPLNSGFEYKFVVKGRYLLDPLNKKITKSKNGLSSLLFMPDYDYPIETLTRINKEYTKLDTLSNNENTLFFYKHPKCSQKAPIIIFLNGIDYLQFAEANIILDNLIDTGKIIPSYAAFLSDNTNVIKQLLFLKEEFNLTGNHFVIGGNKAAGLSIFQNKEIYNYFNSIFIQSAFAETDNLNFLSELQDLDFSNKRTFIGYGHFENQDSVYNTFMNFCESTAGTFKYEKYNLGASWLNWKANLDDALIFFLKQGKKPGL